MEMLASGSLGLLENCRHVMLEKLYPCNRSMEEEYLSALSTEKRVRVLHSRYQMIVGKLVGLLQEQAAREHPDIPITVSELR